MHTHYGINSTSKIRLKSIAELLFKAIEQEQEAKVWDRWIRLCPYMELGQIKFVSFKDYKDALFKPKVKISTKTSEEIMAEIMPVILAHQKNDIK